MSTSDRMNELLDLARDYYGVTADRHLAQHLKIDPSTISRMRNGEHLPPQARAILIILNIVAPGPLPIPELQAA